MLGFDWRKFLFEIINFVIFFFLIKLILFKPILKILSERQEKIRKGLEISEKAETILAQAEAEKENLLAKANEEAEILKADVLRESEKAKADIIKEARDEAEAIVLEAQARMVEERKKTLVELKGQLLNLVTVTTKKVLGEVLTLEQQRALVQQAVMDSLRTFEVEPKATGKKVKKISRVPDGETVIAKESQKPV